MLGKIFTQVLLLILVFSIVLPQNQSGSIFWGQNCARCHNVRGFNEFNDAQWDVIVRHMRIIGNLPGDQARAILKFLQEANNPPEEGNAVEESVKDYVNKRVESFELFPSSKFFVSGYGVSQFVSVKEEVPSFETSFTPLFHLAIGNNTYFMVEPEFELEDTKVAIELEIAQVSYFVNDYLTLVAGKFILPFNVYSERLHPTWIDKLPRRPLIYTNLLDHALSDVGIQLRGGASLPFSEGSKINYAFYIVNGPRLEMGELMIGENFTDVDTNKTIGGRLGILPVWIFEIGASYLSGKASDEEGTRKEDFSMIGFDGEYHFGGLEFRGEFIRLERKFGGWKETKNGFYVQASYRLSGEGFLGNLEPVIRYGSVSHEEEKITQLAFGIDYWLAPSSAIKLAYESNKNIPNRLTLQLVIGL